MGRTYWACPRCGQQQSTEHPNGQTVEAALCAACREEVDKQEKHAETATSKRR